MKKTGIQSQGLGVMDIIEEKINLLVVMIALGY